jgi:hypothetical protein
MSKSKFKILRLILTMLLIGQSLLIEKETFLETTNTQSLRYLQSTTNDAISLAEIPGFSSTDYIKIESLTYLQITTVYENIDQHLKENSPSDSELFTYSQTISKIVSNI